MCAVVTMAARGEKDGNFDTVVARHIFVTNDAGKVVVGLGPTDGGDGLVNTYSANGRGLVMLGSTVDSEGAIATKRDGLLAIGAAA